MDIFLKVTTDLLLICELLIICNKYLHIEKRVYKYKYLLTILVTIIFSIIINAFCNVNTSLLLYLLCVWIILLINFTERKSKLVILELWVTFTAEIVNMLINILVDVISFHLSRSPKAVEDLIASIIATITIYLASIPVNKFSNHGVKNVRPRYLVFFSSILFADVFILTIMSSITEQTSVYKHKVLYTVCFSIVVIGLIIQLIAVLSLIVSRNTAREKEYIATQYLNEQVSYYNYLNQREQETKKFRHDLKNHLHMLQIFSDEKNYEELNNYLKLISDKVDSFTKRISVNNDIADAIINKYDNMAVSNSIVFNVSGHFPEQCKINAYDLCTILSNLLSNALEASIVSSKKEITISCQYDDESIIISISNYYKGSLTYNNGRLFTHKKNKYIHGFGLENVENCVTKNDGYLTINDENSIFCVTVLLRNV